MNQVAHPFRWLEINKESVVSNETASVEDGKEEIRRSILNIHASTKLTNSIVGKL